ncbi:hypothetical protein SAMN05216215_105735 [Saccharopolyspora shandongensis]|uniref:Uncharacterized protein n=1 Tax=Saccharopolyspora shandongensis TaxID=418495 RepID=A0A1H3RSD3_9PSEU|nr:hypothetical protein [Saccharopolyspora shandongensis]SDZ28607.1 hypothetical protein SAMN05216215_105735 [Saccharopolyspora shandongensis]
MLFAALTLLAAIGVAALGFRDQRALRWCRGARGPGDRGALHHQRRRRRGVHDGRRHHVGEAGRLSTYSYTLAATVADGSC